VIDDPGSATNKIRCCEFVTRLTLESPTAHHRERTSTKPRYSEIRRASFTRTIGLPREVDPDRAKATFENGVLSITLQPSTPITGKTIKVLEK
jgi:HSP20 family protein